MSETCNSLHEVPPMQRVHSLSALVILGALSLLSLVGCSPGQDYSTASPTPARQGFLDTLTPGPRNTIATLDTQARQFLDQGQYALAAQHVQQALRIREDAWGEKHPNVALGFDQLADVYSAQGKHAEAETSLQNALAIREHALGAEHPAVATSLERYATFLRQLKRDAEAQPLLTRAQVIRARGAQTLPPPG